jgi:hypothetical protein
MAEQDIKELRNLPLADLITAPLNAVITAQANAAMSTAQFIEKIGLYQKDGISLFDNKDNTDVHKVRMAKMIVEETLPDGSKLSKTVALPFITLFNIPAFEIDSLDWNFNVRLKSVQEFSTTLTSHSEVSTSTTAEMELGIAAKILQVGINTSMTVETASSTDFELRYQSGREQEYNLGISIKARSAPLPRGIEKLLDITEQIANSIIEAEDATNTGGGTTSTGDGTP